MFFFIWCDNIVLRFPCGVLNIIVFPLYQVFIASIFKGGLTSERFLLWLQLYKKCQITSLNSMYPNKEKMIRTLIWPLFGGWSQSEKLSENKPPLEVRLLSTFSTINANGMIRIWCICCFDLKYQIWIISELFGYMWYRILDLYRNGIDFWIYTGWGGLDFRIVASWNGIEYWIYPNRAWKSAKFNTKILEILLLHYFSRKFIYTYVINSQYSESFRGISYSWGCFVRLMGSIFL